jgi:hypothetical protein
VVGTAFAAAGLAATDMGKVATIGLFLGFGGETTLCKLGV